MAALAVMLPPADALADERTAYLERQGARSLANGLRYHVESPQHWPTNLLEVFGFTNAIQLIRFEDRFRELDSLRGFDNSVQEKYLFLPRGVYMTNSSSVIQVVLMNAVPFPNSNDDLMRFVVGWAADGPRYVSISDEKARALLRTHGLENVKPVESQPIPRPPPEPDWLEELKQKYPHVRAEIEAAERAERERKSRIAARVGELGRAATNQAVGAGTNAAEPQPQTMPVAEEEAASHRGLFLGPCLGAAFVAVIAGLLLRRSRS
jgi:hypothetical protein